MSSESKPYTELALGDTIYEADPWDEKVISRHVARIDTYEFMEFQSQKQNKTTRKFFASGGIFGTGKEINKSTWGKKFFSDRELARRSCVEQSVALKQERREHLESEIKSLQADLEGGEQ